MYYKSAYVDTARFYIDPLCDNKGMKLRTVNHLLTVVAMLLGIYIIATPYLPQLSWWIRHEAPVISAAPDVQEARSETPLPENTLIIPGLGLKELINEGQDASALNNGVWLRPNGSTPDTGSNTVLAGHRFTYSDPAVFYHLDKVKVNDAVQLHWEGKIYNYKITEIKVVAPTAVEIEAPSEEPRLTIYTCTPLWTSKERLAIIAEPIEESERL